MKLFKKDIMKCKECGTKTKVKDLKQVRPQRDEAGVLVNLVCPKCDSPCLDLMARKGRAKR